MQHDNADSSWMFLVLLLLIIGPFVFYIVSLFIAWIKWLFVTKEKLNASFSEIEDMKMPLSNTITLRYKLGINSIIDFSILDYDYKEVKKILNQKVENGNHTIDLDTKTLANGQYFLQLITENQKISKLIDIQN